MVRRSLRFMRSRNPSESVVNVTSRADDESPAEAVPADPRYELVLSQVLRGLSQQQGVLDNLRARAGTLVAAASLVSSFFGATALSNEASPPATFWVVLAFLFLGVVVAAAIIIVWPYQWRFGISGHRLLADYVNPESGAPASLDEIRYSLIYYIQTDMDTNEVKLDRLWLALRVAVLAIAAEVICWAVALAAR